MSVLNFLQAGMSYGADKTQYTAQKKWQEYQNKMKDLSATVSQNALTTNELLAADSFLNQAFQLRKDSIFTRAKVEVNAAAAGVKGKSVNRVVREIIGNSASREAERQEAFRVSMHGISQQRKQIEYDAAFAHDYSYIPKPNAASYYLAATQKSIDQAAKAFAGGAGG